MKQLIAFIRKEFYHIFRDSRTLLVILGMPIVQMLLFGFAINMEVQDIRVAIYSPTHNTFSQGVSDKISHNSYFSYKGYLQSMKEVEELMRKEKLDLAVIFPAHLPTELIHSGEGAIQLITNTADPNRGTIAANYATAIISQYWMEQAGVTEIPFQITTENRMIYNPQMKSAYMFVPGIMGLVIMIISTIMTSVSIIREKERGTMEVLLASPLQQGTMVVAKAIPYLIISLLNLISILLLSYFVLKVPIRGNLILLTFLSLLYIFLSLSYGLTISTLVQKQINAIIVSATTVMIPVMMLSGMIFPINNMPVALQYLSLIVPARWFIDAVRKVMIQGLGITMVWKEILIMVGMILLLLTVTIVKTKKRLE